MGATLMALFIIYVAMTYIATDVSHHQAQKESQPTILQNGAFEQETTGIPVTANLSPAPTKNHQLDPITPAANLTGGPKPGSPETTTKNMGGPSPEKNTAKEPGLLVLRITSPSIAGSSNSNEGTGRWLHPSQTEFSSGDITIDTIPVVTQKQAKAMLHDGRFQIENNVTIAIRHDAANKPLPRAVPYKQRAKYDLAELSQTISHLRAIKKAYASGFEMVLIVVDEESLVSSSFAKDWQEMIRTAPKDWKALQWATHHRPALQQGLQLYDHRDLWVTWLPDHYGCHAYTLRRAAMEQILGKSSALPLRPGESWKIVMDRMLVASEVIFYAGMPSYTSTFPWIQSKKTQEFLVSAGLDSQMKEQELAWNSEQARPLSRNESILSLMNIRVDSLQNLQLEMSRTQADVDSLCHTHGEAKCDWIVHAVFTEEFLLEAFEATSSRLPSNVVFEKEVRLEPFNKFAFLQRLSPKMKDYDLVVVKDNDQRITGMPWNTFLDKRGSALLAGPLRQVIEQTRLRIMNYDRYWFNSAENWKNDNTPWSQNLFTAIREIEVPWLEIHFIVMDGKFAEWFWTLALTDEYIAQQSNWGINHLWCPAAKHYLQLQAQVGGGNTSAISLKRSCIQVPVISLHENSKQIYKGDAPSRFQHKKRGKHAISILQKNVLIEKLMDDERPAFNIIQRSTHEEISNRCKRLTKTPNMDLEVCIAKAMEKAKLTNSSRL